MPRKSKQKSGLDEVIDEAIAELKTLEIKDKEYHVAVEQLDKLYKMKQLDKKKQVSADTMALVAGNLIGILVIVGYERTHVLTSAAKSFLLKTR